MYTRYILLVLLFCVPLFAQSWQAGELEKITDAGNGRYFYPHFSPDGTFLVFTKEKFNGLYALDLRSRRLSVLTEAAGAGYQPAISADGKKVYFRKQEFVNRRKQSSLIELDTGSKLEVALVQGSKRLSPPQLTKEQQLVYIAAGELQGRDLKTAALKRGARAVGPLLTIENRSIILYHGENRRELNPFGEGNYIWTSISPDHTRLLFTLAGKGTYISTLEGDILYELGAAHAPQWSPDGQWIAYMRDEDDGYRYTASALFICSVDGNRQIRLTGPDLIAMYPAWAPDGRSIAFHSTRGEIYLLHLLFTGDGKE